MKKRFFILLAGLLLLPLLAESVWAKVYIDIRSPSFRKFPIAISPFKAPLSPNEDLKLGERATEILKREFPELAEKVTLHVPDEKSRRVGQAVAAASLPRIG